MKWISDTSHPRRLHAEIEKMKHYKAGSKQPSGYGYYLIIWENEKCIVDECQDDLDIAMNSALEECAIPFEACKLLEE